MSLEIWSLITGFLGCVGIAISFVMQLCEIYKKKDGSGTSWGMIILQLLASICLATSSSINIYVDGISNVPFLITNLMVIILFIVIAFLKVKYKSEIRTPN
tara:strand:- start:227 stop:529 length:303 start_codon:yes stop_codon:yes gene_type:complete